MKYIYNKDLKYITTTFDEVLDEDIRTVYGSCYITNTKYIAPILKDNEIIETANTHLTLNVENGVIKEITQGKVKGKYHFELIVPYDYNVIDKKEYYKVIDNKLVFNEKAYNEYLQEQEHKELEKKREQLLLDTKELEEYEKTKAFIFKGYLQPNRELEDQTSLLKIISFMQISKQTKFSQWKMKDSNDNECYVELTIQEMIELGQIMEQQTTKTMVKWSNIRESIKAMDYETLKSYELPKESSL